MVGAFDEDAAAADLLQQYEARIASLERLVGKQALELEFLKGALKSAPRPKGATTSVVVGPPGLSIAEGCRLMEIAGSNLYDKSATQDNTAIVASDFPHVSARNSEFYGWRHRRTSFGIEA